jgi:hypothetical protein
MFRKPWLVVVPTTVITFGVMAVILWRYVRAGAGPVEVSSWFAVGGVTFAAVLVVFNLVTAKTHLRMLSLSGRGGVLSVAATRALGEELRRRTESGALGTLPEVVSVTWTEAGAKFWEGGLDPIPLATIPWRDVSSLDLEPRSDVWIHPTSALVFTFSGGSRPALRLPLVSPSLIGFGAISRRPAERAYAKLSHALSSGQESLSGEPGPATQHEST